LRIKKKTFKTKTPNTKKQDAVQAKGGTKIE